MFFTFLGIKQGSTVQILASKTDLATLAQAVVVHMETGKNPLDLKDTTFLSLIDYDLIGVQSNHFQHFIDCINEADPRFPKQSEKLDDGTLVTYQAEWIYFDADAKVWLTEDSEITTATQFNYAHFVHSNYWGMYEHVLQHVGRAIVDWAISHKMTINHGAVPFTKQIDGVAIQSTWSLLKADLKGPIGFKTLCYNCHTFDDQCNCSENDWKEFALTAFVPF